MLANYDELVSGADNIAAALFGKSDSYTTRRVRYLAKAHGLPTFKVGRTLCAKRSKLQEWVQEQEKKVNPAH